MRRTRSGIVCLAIVFALRVEQASAWESTWSYTVEITSVVRSDPPAITLNWIQDTNAAPVSYTVSRKAPLDTAWTQLAVLSGDTTNFIDTEIAAGMAYEYQVAKAADGLSGYGYIETGVNAPMVDNRGTIVLIVDNSFTESLAFELNRLEMDLVGDGWTVLRHDVSRTNSVEDVKALVLADYFRDETGVKSVFLFGHIPVPYSGLLNPDQHPDHLGAWPADVYYGNMAGTWTDDTVDYQQTLNSDPADAARLSNVPGDGKFDQTVIPSAVELEVGRVDLANMPGRLTSAGPPSFPSELELLRQYLNKDHDYRTAAVVFQRRALVADYLGVELGEAFAASAYRNFSALLGPENITNLNVLDNDAEGVWIPTLAQEDYLCAYGCGPGSYLTIGGLGNTGDYNDGSTTEVVENNTLSVFNLVFGSWFGDWDHEDDVMRAFLATQTAGLVAAWSGRPHWFIHPMGLGETIGYCARLTQNNTGLYLNESNLCMNFVHIALMGDPTLRLHTVGPPTQLQGTAGDGGVSLSWTASNDAVAGYHVYRGPGASGPFTRLTDSPITQTSYFDASASAADTYMVRAVKLEATVSGSYFNPSQGVFWNAAGLPDPVDTDPISVSITAPVDESVASGTVVLSAQVSGAVTAATVDFQIDGQEAGLDAGGAPYSLDWDTTTVADGPHTVTAVASDAAGNQAVSGSVTLWVGNDSPGPPAVGIVAGPGIADRVARTSGGFTITRTGDTSSDATVSLAWSGTAVNGDDYESLASTVTIPAGSTSATIIVTPSRSTVLAGPKTAVATILAEPAYWVTEENSATVTISGNSVTIGSILHVEGGGVSIVWPSTANRIYRVAYKSNLSDPWTDVNGGVVATGSTTSWTDTADAGVASRFYLVYVVN